MTPLELIKQGYELKDWSKIAEGYKTLTGSDLDLQEVINIKTAISEKKKPGRKKKNSVIVPTQQEVKEVLGEVDSFTEFRTPPLQPKHSGEGGVGARKVPFKVQTKFFDDKTAFVEDTKAFQKLNKKFKASNRRPEIVMVKVNCKSCGKTENLPEEFASRFDINSTNDTKPQFYCNNCSR